MYGQKDGKWFLSFCPHHFSATFASPYAFALMDYAYYSTFPLRPIIQDEFAAIDYQVMRHAFASQNTLGRFCDEVIYRSAAKPNQRG
jgi:hypothetical protein